MKVTCESVKLNKIFAVWFSKVLQNGSYGTEIIFLISHFFVNYEKTCT